VGDETVAVRATELTGAERDEKYRAGSERFLGFAVYRQVTSKSISVIAAACRDAPPPGAGATSAVDVEGGQFHGMRLLGSAP
jgi:hypothetical protein